MLHPSCLEDESDVLPDTIWVRHKERAGLLGIRLTPRGALGEGKGEGEGNGYFYFVRSGCCIPLKKVVG